MKTDALKGKFVRMKNDKGRMEVVKILRVVSENAEVWGKPCYHLEVRRRDGRIFNAFQPKDVEPRIIRECIFCGKPLRINMGAEHTFFCALRHPLLSLKGWYFHLSGQHEKRDKVQEEVRRRRKQ